MGKRYKKNKSRKKHQEKIDYSKAIEAYDELDELKTQYPEIVKKVDPKLAKPTIMERLLQFYLNMRERFHTENTVDKRVYCWLCLLGFLGVHQFYSKHWIKGLIYLAVSWSGISVAMSLLDWMVAYPKEADKDGLIVI